MGRESRLITVHIKVARRGERVETQLKFSISFEIKKSQCKIACFTDQTGKQQSKTLIPGSPEILAWRLEPKAVLCLEPTDIKILILAKWSSERNQ